MPYKMKQNAKMLVQNLLIKLGINNDKTLPSKRSRISYTRFNLWCSCCFPTHNLSYIKIHPFSQDNVQCRCYSISSSSSAANRGIQCIIHENQEILWDEIVEKFITTWFHGWLVSIYTQDPLDATEIDRTCWIWKR